MSALAGSRRTYVAPRRGLGHRLAAPAPRHAGPALTAAIALAVVATAFAARGGSQLERTTWTEVAVLVTSAGVCLLALLLPRPAGTPTRLRGAWVLAAFGALCVFTALSISWSLMPSDSWFEANRTLTYFAAMAGGLALGRLAPGGWNALIIGLAVAAVALSTWSLLTKVFPAALAANEPFARLRPPLDYWNSVGLTAALGIPPLLWLAARRSGHAAVNALAWPGLGLAIVCLLLAYSRGALLALGIGLAIWFAAVPLRLRAAVALGSVVAATAPVVVWAFAQEGLTLDRAPMALREDAGVALGALLLLLAASLTVAGLAVGFLSAQHPPGPIARRRATRILVGALVTAPAVAILMLANAPGGLSGQVSKAWRQATDPKVTAPANSPDRLTQTSSGRARYWREAMKVHADSPWLGGGAGAYGTLRLRYRQDERNVEHAHGYVVQTLADLGWAGLALSLLAAGAWLFAAARTVGLRRRDRGLPWDAERVGLATVACVVLVFGIHSGIDWTWFVPANALPALICAGWVASRPPLRERLVAPEPAGAPGRPGPARLGLAGLVVATAVAASWSAVQPVRSEHAQQAALQRAEQGAFGPAAAIARIAHERNPLDVDPLFELSSIYRAQGDNAGALRELGRAVDLEPANPETWRRLGQTRLDLGDPDGALLAFRAAYFLDPKSLRSVSDVVVASRAIDSG